MPYHVFDLVCERANEKDWILIFDSGPHGDLRTVIWEHPMTNAAGSVTELEITFSPDGRILSAERRDVGISCHRISAPDAFTTTDVCIETLQLIGSAVATHDAKFAAIVGPLRASMG